MTIAAALPAAGASSASLPSPSDACRRIADAPVLVGTVDDGVTSLAEAIDSLTTSPECSQARSRVVVAPELDLITADAALPVLAGLEGVVIDGSGVTLDGAGQGVGFAIASSDLVLKDFSLQGFGTAISLKPQGVADLDDIELSGLDISVQQFGVDIVGGDSSATIGTLSHVVIRDSRFEGVEGADALAGINVTAMTGSVGARIAGLHIRDNWFGDHLLERIQLVGIQGLGSGVVEAPPAPQLQYVEVTGNTFSTCPDPCVLAYAALTIGGRVDGAQIDGLRITANEMHPNGLGVMVIGGYTLGPGVTTNASTTRVLVARNDIASVRSEHRCTGIAFVGGWTDFHAGVMTAGRVRDVRVVGNRVAGCQTGLMATGTFASEEVGGTVQDSAVEGLLARHNRFIRNGVAVHLTGATIRYGRVFANSPTQSGAGLATLVGNVGTGIRITDNRFTANQLMFLLAGASVSGTNGHVVTDNVVGDVVISGVSARLNQQRCLVLDTHAPDSANVTSGNSAAGVACPDRQVPTGRQPDRARSAGPRH